MGISTKTKNRFGRSQVGSNADSITSDSIRFHYNANRVDPGKGRGKNWRGLLKITFPPEKKAVSKVSGKGGTKTVNNATVLTGIWLSPTMINSCTPQEFERLQDHPDYDYMIETGIIELINPRQIKKGDEMVNVATATTYDYQVNDAIQIIRKSCDPTFLSQSLSVEQQQVSSDSNRNRVVEELRRRIQEVQTTIDSRINRSGRALNTTGALAGMG